MVVRAVCVCKVTFAGVCASGVERSGASGARGFGGGGSEERSRGGDDALEQRQRRRHPLSSSQPPAPINNLRLHLAIPREARAARSIETDRQSQALSRTLSSFLSFHARSVSKRAHTLSLSSASERTSASSPSLPLPASVRGKGRTSGRERINRPPRHFSLFCANRQQTSGHQGRATGGGGRPYRTLARVSSAAAKR